MNRLDIKAGSEEAEEEIIELTDVIEEPGQESASSDVSGVIEDRESVSAEDEEIIDLLDEVKGEDVSKEEEPIEVTDVAEEELLDLEVPDEESKEDILLEGLGIEMEEEGAEAAAEETEQQASPIAEEFKEQQPSAPPVAEVADEKLESAVRERLSDEKIEAVIRQIVQEKIEKKVDRILLEAAETAISSEIERLKQAL
ncbi:MAG: hypothetical protein JRI41_06165 [Deltaproteobacteria bacterium]|nr:hypothetical protein [Deltaproteobacteria bacterium]RLB89889.1 MAG: hypothetical protein DRH10_05110 [Deltaproteobacteria bacterium]RLB95329.1 MAG: hypothetical protein DRH50_04505 [Deltaproteobacteria bacterium]RLC08489.1 MAG: hypothetical protein DRH43_09975 [Deltaproteobacteria bacterium]